MAFGLLSTGFNRKRLADCQEELEAAFKAAFGAGIKTGGDSAFGILIGILAEREAEVWELAEAVYLSPFPDDASGVALDNAVAITGHRRLGSTKSTVTVTCTGTPGTVLAAGRVLSVEDSGDRFVSLEEATIGGGGTVSVEFEAEEVGAVQAEPDTLTVIETPVSGWTAATNPDAADTGRAVEGDVALRQRRAETLVTSRGGTFSAMEARLAEVDGVIFAGARENRTDTTDGDGRPPHSVEVVVVGGTDADVAAAIWATKPAGIATHGDETVNITDSFGEPQAVKFTRGTEVEMYVTVELTATADYPGGTDDPTEGDADVEAAILAYGATLESGDDVINWRLGAALGEIPGITALVVKQGTTVTPTLSANTAIAPYEIATFDASRVVVTRTGP